jgi:hypothetical protein
LGHWFECSKDNVTQTGICNVFLPSEHKVRKKAPWLSYPSIKSDFYTDQLFSKIKDVHNHNGGSVFTNGLGYDQFYPWISKGEHPNALKEFINEIGIPKTLISDNTPEEVRGESRKICQKYHIRQRVTVPHSPWQNLAKASIRELKKSCRQIMRRLGTPTQLWSYCMIWCAAIRQLTSNSITRLRGRTPEEHTFGSTPDVSMYAMFDLYQIVEYLAPVNEYPEQKQTFGWWIGVSENCIDEMASVILTKNGQVIIRKSIWGLSDDDLLNPVKKAAIAVMDELINSKN